MPSLHVGGNVGNMHAYLPQIFSSMGRSEGIVSVFGIGGVYGKGGYLPKVHAGTPRRKLYFRRAARHTPPPSLG